jgi:hypothetical protein
MMGPRDDFLEGYFASIAWYQDNHFQQLLSSTKKMGSSGKSWDDDIAEARGGVPPKEAKA